MKFKKLSSNITEWFSNNITDVPPPTTTTTTTTPAPGVTTTVPPGPEPEEPEQPEEAQEIEAEIAKGILHWKSVPIVTFLK